MAGPHNPDDLRTFVLRIPGPLKDMLWQYAQNQHLSMNMAIRHLCETHPHIAELYRKLTDEEQA